MANKKSKVRFTASPSSTEREDSAALIARLRAELDAERKISRQLRREKALEVQAAREQEQTKASISLKELAARLQQEKQKDLELQKEALQSKLESDYGKVLKVKDQELKKVKQDLARCQNELQEELTKRGLSTSARATFDTERNRLLQQVKELNVVKKQLESVTQAASETEKRKNLEIRQLQENCKLELAGVEKSANVEVKKLLEELKSKDNMIAMMDGNVYPDKRNMLKQRVKSLTVEELLSDIKMSGSSENYNTQSAPAVPAGSHALQTVGLHKKLYDMEKQVKFANGLQRSLIDKNNSLSSTNKQLEDKINQLTKKKKVPTATLR